MSPLLDRLRARLITVPKPGTEPFKPGPSGITMFCDSGVPHKAGDDAGLQTVSELWRGSYGEWRVQEHVYAVEPLCAEAAAEIERRDAEIERLRAGLEKILAEDGSIPTYQDLLRIVRAALERK
jgi:hypothetical protein